MSTLFLICAVLGGTLLACQSLLSLLGLGGHHDLGDAHDIAVDHGGDLGDHNVGSHDATGPHAESAGSELFRMLTFRAVVAALAFFGLAGLTARAAHWEEVPTLAVALAAGALALWSVHQMMQGISKLRVDGTVRLDDAVGQSGSVYLRIPAASHGVGKIHLTLSTQTLELSARSCDGEIPTGETVRVLRVLGPDLVEVTPLA